jgi:hypothetical protein
MDSGACGWEACIEFARGVEAAATARPLDHARATLGLRMLQGAAALAIPRSWTHMQRVTI